MRILSYNILDGGQDRALLLGDVIDAQRPDVVALVEADDPEVVDRLARRLKMDFIHAAGNSYASALLSRLPIRESVNHAPLHPALTKSLLEATVTDPALGELTVGVVHLHHRASEQDEDTRLRELAVVLDVFAPHRRDGRPHVIAGDFNTNAPRQRIDPERCKPQTRQAWADNGGHLPRRVVQAMLDAGYRDSLAEADPPAAETVGTFTTEFPGQRVDYLFTFGVEPGRLRAGWVVQDEKSKRASDHFPVGLELA